MLNSIHATENSPQDSTEGCFKSTAEISLIHRLELSLILSFDERLNIITWCSNQIFINQFKINCIYVELRQFMWNLEKESLIFIDKTFFSESDL